MNAPATTAAFDVTESTEVPYVPGGQQAVVDLFDCQALPSSSAELHRDVRDAAGAMDAHIIEKCQGHGVSSDGHTFTSAVGLEESSACAVVRINAKLAFIDIFTCGEKAHPVVGAEYLRKKFRARAAKVIFHGRGKNDEIVDETYWLDEDGRRVDESYIRHKFEVAQKTEAT